MSVQKSVRLPEDLFDWIDSLPASYGKDVSNKIITLLYREKELAETVLINEKPVNYHIDRLDEMSDQIKKISQQLGMDDEKTGTDK